jgi:hypothetical protein
MTLGTDIKGPRRDRKSGDKTTGGGVCVMTKGEAMEWDGTGWAIEREKEAIKTKHVVGPQCKPGSQGLIPLVGGFHSIFQPSLSPSSLPSPVVAHKAVFSSPPPIVNNNPSLSLSLLSAPSHQPLHGHSQPT